MANITVKYLGVTTVMAQSGQKVAAPAAGAGGPGLATEQGPVSVPSAVWNIVEKGVMIDPTFTITIKARQEVVISSRDVEVEINRFGLSIKSFDTELIIDPRYNTAMLRRGDKLIALSDKVRYRWLHGQEYEKVYEARDFAELVKKSVKEIIEEAAATAGL
jgi:hypothetical protein